MLKNQRDWLPNLGDTQKIRPEMTKPTARLQYLGPRGLSDQTVYELALTGSSLEDIGRFFGVGYQTVSDLHGDAFKMGKNDFVMKPRRGCFIVLEELERRLLKNMGQTYEMHGEVHEALLDQDLLNQYAKYLGIARSYQPKEIAITQPDNPAQRLSDEELKTKIKQLMKEKE